MPARRSLAVAPVLVAPVLAAQALLVLAQIGLCLTALVPGQAQAQGLPIDEATLQREYGDYRASLKGLHLYGVHYILVASEDEARQMIARVRSGGNFADLAKRDSLHKASAPQGGNLGIHASCRWSRDTVTLLDSLSPGQVYPKPVKGSNGWGVYRLDSKVAVVPRSFEQYRDELLAGRFEPECPWQPPVSVGASPASK